MFNENEGDKPPWNVNERAKKRFSNYNNSDENMHARYNQSFNSTVLRDDLHISSLKQRRTKGRKFSQTTSITLKNYLYYIGLLKSKKFDEVKKGINYFYKLFKSGLKHYLICLFIIFSKDNSNANECVQPQYLFQIISPLTEMLNYCIPSFIEAKALNTISNMSLK